MIRNLVLLISLATSTAAYALDASDSGTYALVDGDRVMDIMYFVSCSGTQWNLQSKISGGTWTDVLCKQACSYHSSTETDVERYFPERELREVGTLSCIDNTEFAFCEFRSRVDPKEKGYIIRAVGTPEAVPFLVKKLADERLGP
jgi:hypothetical protein